MTVRTAVLINPGAGRSNGKGLALAGLLKGHGTVDLRVADSFGQVGYIIRELMNEGVTRLYISAGDGTVDAVLTLLAEAGYATPALQLGLLPHGTTNMTAADVGLRARSVTAQASFIATGNFNEQIQRHTMRISNALDNNVRHGMFLGVGAVAEAARYSQQVFNSRGIGGNTAPFAVLASAVMKTVFKRADPEDKNRFDRPFPISIEACGKNFSDGPQLLAISTTLSRLILNSRPFWGGGDGAIRTTILPYPFPNVLRWVGPVMFGTEHRKVPPGSISLRSSKLTMACSAPFILDGEFFEGTASQPLHIETGALFSYIVS